MSFTSAPQQKPSSSQPTPSSTQHWRQQPTYPPNPPLKPPFASSVAHTMTAPLPSPSSEQPTQYFSTTSHAHTQRERNSQQPAQQGRANTYPQQRQQQHSSSETQQQQQHQQQHQYHQPEQQASNNNGSTATSPFLRDFNLVAEAAKRAQMGILMRDLDGVSLS